MNNKTTNVRYLAQLALLAAIEVVMKLMGLGSVPVGPLYMSFLTVPIAVGAMTMGPTAGAILGGVFGLVSMKDAITGASVMTGAFFQITTVPPFSPIFIIYRRLSETVRRRDRLDKSRRLPYNKHAADVESTLETEDAP